MLFQVHQRCLTYLLIAEIPFQTSSLCLFKATGLRRYLFLFINTTKTGFPVSNFCPNFNRFKDLKKPVSVAFHKNRPTGLQSLDVSMALALACRHYLPPLRSKSGPQKAEFTPSLRWIPPLAWLHIPAVRTGRPLRSEMGHTGQRVHWPKSLGMLKLLAATSMSRAAAVGLQKVARTFGTPCRLQNYVVYVPTIATIHALPFRVKESPPRHNFDPWDDLGGVHMATGRLTIQSMLRYRGNWPLLSEFHGQIQINQL